MRINGTKRLFGQKETLLTTVKRLRIKQARLTNHSQKPS